MPILELTSRERGDLRSAAHPLKPVVLIGDAGLTDAVLKEIDRALNSHELIKVRAGGEDRDTREAMLASICDTLSCAPVHHLGKLFILFRPSADTPAEAAEASGKRRASEPHTPKKLAAEGKTLGKTRSRKPAEGETPKTAAPRSVPLNEKGRPMRPSTRKPQEAAGHGIPRRSGSALSLRDGARTGTSARGGLQRARVIKSK
ncbi:YhbY family RNA-binding protein [Bordetella holmesii]|uniref:CRS1 / YhbY domain protein n=1 Tax=Bordetella holmesii 1058 TaxID=1247648 RepID=A0ABN0RX63_9BORD|nr:YhbY family RNA-binding protein [Bordetella holmesii]AHV91781.1 CRS1 / YhbY domain protein [Bordetella holmesii ATCC 51541]AIT27753.1 CRS1 / YhbY domain protein [Bordetella holmesii 44057]EWM40525.1 CRS1 / YhbY domain protein [Bordetella holmesii 35009]EWM43646.1 CRS1 / YhbY domain protein [Bordetella holmesii 41130]EWM49330.1 CRS1 / YhbY domain protein [Bordetella holmesii 70147]